jgi:biotin transporter BioY
MVAFIAVVLLWLSIQITSCFNSVELVLALAASFCHGILLGR